MYIPKDKLEEEFEALLQSMKLPSQVGKLVEILFNKVAINPEVLLKELSSRKEKDIKKLKEKLVSLEDKLIQTNNVKLYERLEQEWAVTNSELEVLQEDLNSQID